MTDEEIKSLIRRRRRQLLVHSFIYYDLDENLISDSQWSKWGVELAELQMKYPHLAEQVEYHNQFIGFDGSTGCDLLYRSPEIVAKAYQLIEYGKSKRGDIND